jgi:GTP-binding protein HflX
MNTLTRAGVMVEDKLFATLDPTTRALRLPNADKVMIVDTVGFINKIPHSLIEAFKSTLEDVTRADLLLHLIDMVNPLCREHIAVIEQVLSEIGAGMIPTVLVPNKVDIAGAIAARELQTNNVVAVCPISALTGAGVGELLETVGQILDRDKEQLDATFTPAQGALVALLRERGRVIKEVHDGSRIHVTALVSPKLAGQVRKWLSGDGRSSTTLD